MAVRNVAVPASSHYLLDAEGRPIGHAFSVIALFRPGAARARLSTRPKSGEDLLIADAYVEKGFDQVRPEQERTHSAHGRHCFYAITNTTPSVSILGLWMHGCRPHTAHGR